MSADPPTPPADLPAELVDGLDEASPDRLRKIADYAEALAEHKAREARPEEERDRDDEDRPDDQPDDEDRPDDVPSKATITIKEINDNRYYYWQWRDGDAVRSRYKGPVTPDS